MCLLDASAIGREWEVDWPAHGNTKLTVTSLDRSGASAEKEEVMHPRWQQQRQRPLLDLPARLLQRCEVHEYIFSVMTSGVICVLKLCYALQPFNYRGPQNRAFGHGSCLVSLKLVLTFDVLFALNLTDWVLRFALVRTQVGVKILGR